jgi:hypothetical protein
MPDYRAENIDSDKFIEQLYKMREFELTNK